MRSSKALFLLGILCLLLLWQGQLWQSVTALGVWLSFFFLTTNTKTKKRFLRPYFWLWATLFILGFGALVGPKTTAHDFVSVTGIIAGIQMLCRGALLFSLTLWLSTTVRKEKLIAITKSLHIEPVGQGISTAFLLLPFMEEHLHHIVGNTPKKQLFHPHHAAELAATIIASTALTAEAIPQKHTSSS